MRLIDADALELRVEKFEQLTGMKLDIVHDFVGSAPTIDAVEVVRGEWIDMGDFEQCSVCRGTHLKEFQSYYGKTTWVKTPYCPWCGARMKGADDD